MGHLKGTGYSCTVGNMRMLKSGQSSQLDLTKKSVCKVSKLIHYRTVQWDCTGYPVCISVPKTLHLSVAQSSHLDVTLRSRDQWESPSLCNCPKAKTMSPCVPAFCTGDIHGEDLWEECRKPPGPYNCCV